MESKAVPLPSSWLVVGSPGCRRVALFQEALAAAGQPPAVLLPWTDLLAGRADLRDRVRAGTVVRIESPGKDPAAERAFLAAGAELPDEAGEFYRLPARAAAALPVDRGRILCSRQWYLGFRAALRRIEAQLASCPPHRCLQAPAEIAVMFDKPACHARLAAFDLPLPPALGPVRGFEELAERMRERGWARAFLKLAHGSSASGTVAYARRGAQHRALTTVETARVDGELRLYNTRRLRLLTDPRELAALVDALARHRFHVEAWLPKAGLDGRAFDLRVVVIDGAARHMVVRLARGPVTNLHLLNARGDPAAVRERMGGAAWEAATGTCARAAGAFPRSLYAGIDLLVRPGYRRHAVLEVNAFGDLLPGVLWQGIDTYATEIMACSTPARSSAPTTCSS